MADAVCIAASTSPGSMKFQVSCEWCAQTPARQSACNSTRTWTWLASTLSRPCARIDTQPIADKAEHDSTRCRRRLLLRRARRAAHGSALGPNGRVRIGRAREHGGAEQNLLKAAVKYRTVSRHE